MEVYKFMLSAIVYMLIGFIICLFVPTSRTAWAKQKVINLYNKIISMLFSKNKKE